MCFEASEAVFWLLSCYNNKELKLITKPFTGRTLRSLLIQMQNISLRSSGMRRKQNFKFQGLEVTVVWTFTFCFISSPLFLLFLPRFFFSQLSIQQASFWWEKFLGKRLGSWDQHDDITSGRKDVDLHGRLRGEWVMDMINL